MVGRRILFVRSLTRLFTRLVTLVGRLVVRNRREKLGSVLIVCVWPMPTRFGRVVNLVITRNFCVLRMRTVARVLRRRMLNILWEIMFDALVADSPWVRCACYCLDCAGCVAGFGSVGYCVGELI